MIHPTNTNPKATKYSLRILGASSFVFHSLIAIFMIQGPAHADEESKVGSEKHGHSSPENMNEHNHQNQEMSMEQELSAKKPTKTVYTCPMHPQIRQPGEGRCPICGMELVLIESEEGEDPTDDAVDDGVIKISPVSRRVAGIRTMTVKAAALTKKIKAIGHIRFDESRLATIPAYVGGRIEKLYADYTGVSVKKGDHLAVLYSPDLYSAQVEYLQSRRSLRAMGGSTLGGVLSTQRELLKNAKTKLSEFGMSDLQIKSISKTGKAVSRLEIYSPIGGTVIAKPAAQGQYLKAGQTIFKIADLSTVWLMVDVFPEDATNIHYGQQVEARVRSVLNKTFKGRVAFVDPVVNPKTRTVGIRVEITNDAGNLRPGDYAEAEISVPVSTTGRSAKIFDPTLAGKHICPMHPQIINDEAGQCSVCGMPTVKAESFGFTDTLQEHEKIISVPRNALLRVGRNSVVFVEESEGMFRIKRVNAGPAVGDNIVILDGIEEFDTIAVDGVFLLDSQMQLTGKTSLIDIAPLVKDGNRDMEPSNKIQPVGTHQDH